MANIKDYYSILGIVPGASKSDIRKAYLEAIKLAHPDHTKAEVGTRFFDVQEAFNILNDEESRSQYDLDLEPAPPILELFQSNLTLSRSILPKQIEQQLLYAMVDLEPTRTVGQDLFAPALNLCLVIDISSSMKGFKLEEVKRLCFKLAKTLNPADILSLVTFNDFAEVTYKAQAVNMEVLPNKIQLMQGDGGTEIFTGLEAGFQEIKKYLGTEKHNQIILLTDGHTYGDQDKCLELSKTAAANNIFINCYGIGSEWNDKLLDEIASNTGGYCDFLPFGTDYHEQVLSDIEKITTAKTTNIKLNISDLEHCSIRVVHRLQPNQGPLPTLSPINIGPIPAQGSLSLLVEILVDPTINITTPLHLCDLRLEMVGTFKLNIRKEYSLNILVPLGTLPFEQEPPINIVRSLELLQLAKMQEKARYEISMGNVDTAITHLQKLTTILEKNGNLELAKTVHFEIMNIQKTHKFSDEGELRIKYGTRALRLPDLEEK